ERALRRACELDEGHAEAFCNLGLLLARQGRLDEGARFLRQGHALGAKRKGWPYPSARWLDEAEAARALLPRLPEVIAGKDKPADTGERLRWAGAAEDYLKQPALALRLYAEALKEEPRVSARIGSRPRVQAAGCAVALGGAHRAQALALLREDVDRCRKAEGSDAKDAAAWLPVLLSLRELAPVRDEPGLSSLPEEERESWTALWADARRALEALRRR
ncbi:MAG: hypothetical protein K2W96_27490, partial [Gemmataceae bacterium]|nr:hypothetical protein [Gemmataceae bacterium]